MHALSNYNDTGILIVTPETDLSADRQALNANFKALGSVVTGGSAETTVTSGGTTTLTTTSAYNQFFTGSDNQNVVLPACPLGQKFLIVSAAGNEISVFAANGTDQVVQVIYGTMAWLTCVDDMGTTAAAWNFVLSDAAPLFSWIPVQTAGQVYMQAFGNVSAYEVLGSAYSATAPTYAEVVFTSAVLLNYTATDGPSQDATTQPLLQLTAPTSQTVDIAQIYGQASNLCGFDCNANLYLNDGGAGNVVLNVQSGKTSLDAGAITLGDGAGGGPVSFANGYFTVDSSGNVAFGGDLIMGGGVFNVDPFGNAGCAGNLTCNLLQLTGAAPASSIAAGTKGQVVVDSGYIYVCTAANTWKRAALTSW